jgi:hypothetical protein
MKRAGRPRPYGQSICITILVEWFKDIYLRNNLIIEGRGRGDPAPTDNRFALRSWWNGLRIFI